MREQKVGHSPHGNLDKRERPATSRGKDCYKFAVLHAKGGPLRPELHHALLRVGGAISRQLAGTPVGVIVSELGVKNDLWRTRGGTSNIAPKTNGCPRQAAQKGVAHDQAHRSRGHRKRSFSHRGQEARREHLINNHVNSTGNMNVRRPYNGRNNIMKTS